MRTLSALAVLGLIAATSPLAAQDAPTLYPPIHKGFTASAGFGLSPSSSDCPNCDNLADELGGTAFLRVGYSLHQQLKLALRADGWLNKGTNETRRYTAAVIEAQVYPIKTAGLYIEGGAGSGSTYFDHPNDQPLAPSDTMTIPSRLESKAPAILVGIGYDFRVQPDWSLTPYVSVIQINKAPLKFTKGFFTGSNSDYGVRLVQVGFSLVWR